MVIEGLLAWGWLWLQIFIRGAWVHSGDGTPARQADLWIEGDSIRAIAASLPIPSGALVIEAQGKHLYPGFIALGTAVGLVEIEQVRATADFAERGDFTPEARAYTAYNIDSRILPTLRAAGILYVESVPRGGVIAGISAIFALRGRTREEAVVLPEAALHLFPPSLVPSPYTSYEEQKEAAEHAHKVWKEIEFFWESAARWCAGDSAQPNLRYRAVCPCFHRKLPVVWHVEHAHDIEAALQLSRRWNLRIAIAGGNYASTIASQLKALDVPVILQPTHRLPPSEDAPLHFAYRLPAVLRDSGIAVMLSHISFWNQRNLAYNAGTAAAYGLSREEALRLLTDYPAQWLGLSRVGRIAPGYKASLVLSEGDILDIPTSRVLRIWVEGKEISISDNPQEQLFQKYR
ncbi:MAG: amidohydrolase family protein [Bacteroidia bacterium]|nr:amidohydrolase family protein [Bacteroidia bacterium]MDW8235778.1 amidohydrolase family protein [Bacteroidia bacterium]